MGATKRNSETETFGTQHRTISTNRRQQRPVSEYSLGKPLGSIAKDPSLDSLFRQLWLGLRRKFTALGFQFQQRTGVLFQKRVVLNAGLVCAVVFVYFHLDDARTIDDQVITPAAQGVGITFDESAPVEYSGSKPNKAAKRKNEAAPVSRNELTPEMTIGYINRFKNIAVKEMNKYGIPASISLAQGLIESRAGTSKLAVSNNNHFGMKCFSRNCKKGHCSNFTDDTHKDFFRKYGSATESWEAHSRLISTGRYAKLKKYGRDYRKWAYGLKSIGYATDRTYAEKLIGMIERYDLYKYDR